MTSTPHFDREAVMRLPPTAVADAMAIACPAAAAPPRHPRSPTGTINLEDGAATFLISGAFSELDILTVKVISVRPDNPGRGLARLQGGLLAFSFRTGELLATIDAAAATEVRTAAGSALSVRLLAPRDVSALTVYGTAAQARGHVRAIRAERPIREVRVAGHSAEHARAFAAEVGGQVAASARDALAGAHVAVAATNSRTPIFMAADVEPGTHVCAPGNGARDATELEPALFGRCSAIFVDHLPSCMREAGELIAAIDGRIVAPDQVHELGELVTGAVPGRTADDAITCYKSVGHGTQDAAFAALLLGRI